jgi:hypothetical protein
MKQVLYLEVLLVDLSLYCKHVYYPKEEKDAIFERLPDKLDHFGPSI